MSYGTHMSIEQSNENVLSYKTNYIINCQEICNYNGKFIYVKIKWLDSVHNARVFANSEVAGTAGCRIISGSVEK